ncbi:uncharacterized protein B0T15DRAFT_506162 [Chaetomium strumarium]|uniref:Uncharacterized protein n=1 Tax=Chaetomium strumarium TaxID=1170767 RepID=A0AAJ0H090_9PEZI|nr:hypothetical protein B0T15DRAFT_506162 [Chaetomium strumarium]
MSGGSVDQPPSYQPQNARLSEDATDDENSTNSKGKNVDSGSMQISGAPVMVTWPSEGNPKSLASLWSSGHERICLRLHHDVLSNDAFCQIRATNIALKGRKDKVSVFLSIHWETVRSLVIASSDDEIGLLAATRLGTSVVGLQFSLQRPPALVVPKGDCTPRQRTTGEILNSLQSLAKEVVFTVYLPAAEASQAGLEALCQVASSGRLRSIDRLYEVTSLYGGKGGHVIQHERRPSGSDGSLPPNEPALPPPSDADEEPPPSYEEAGPSASPGHAAPGSQKCGTKRRRVSSGSNSERCSHKCVSAAQMEAMCSKILQRIDQGFSQIHARLAPIERRLAELNPTVHSCADPLETGTHEAHLRTSKEAEDLRHDLEQGLDDVRRELEQGLDDVRQDLERGLDDVRQELDDIISVRIEDEVYTAQQNLEDHVRDAMREATEQVEEKVVERLSCASVSISFG